MRTLFFSRKKLQHFSRTTRLTFLCTARVSEFAICRQSCINTHVLIHYVFSVFNCFFLRFLNIVCIEIRNFHEFSFFSSFRIPSKHRTAKKSLHRSAKKLNASEDTANRNPPAECWLACLVDTLCHERNAG